nr:nucleic acid-binding, OB-fold protein [Tanacetum cinerariifolium]
MIILRLLTSEGFVSAAVLEDGLRMSDVTPDPRDFPTEILNLAGQTHLFQFYYNPSCAKGRVYFYFDDILNKPLQITGPPETPPAQDNQNAQQAPAIAPNTSRASISVVAIRFLTPTTYTGTPTSTTAIQPNTGESQKTPTATPIPVTPMTTESSLQTTGPTIPPSPKPTDKQVQKTPETPVVYIVKQVKRTLFPDESKKEKKLKKD